MEIMDPSDKRELIFAAALRLFNEQGFDRTPTSRITREAGVATGTLFHYFGTKEDLINALYLRCKERMVNAAVAGIDQAAPYRTRLRRVYENLLDWVCSSPGEYLFFQQFSSSAHIRGETRERGRSTFEPVFGMLQEGREGLWFKNAPAEFLFELIAGMIVSTAGYLLEHPEERESKAFRDLSFSILWDSLRA